MWINVNSFDSEQGVLLVHHNLRLETEDGKDVWKRSSTLKTDKSWREVPLPDITLKILREWILFRPEFIRLNNKKDDGSLFPSHKNQYPIRPYKLQLLCKQINKDYDLPNIHPHSFRHTYASLLQSAGVSAKQTQILLGHEDIKTTLNIYTHVTNEDKKIAINKLNTLMAPKNINYAEIE